MIFGGMIITRINTAQVLEEDSGILPFNEDMTLNGDGWEVSDINDIFRSPVDFYVGKIKRIVFEDIEEGIIKPNEALQGLEYATNHLRHEFRPTE